MNFFTLYLRITSAAHLINSLDISHAEWISSFLFIPINKSLLIMQFSSNFPHFLLLPQSICRTKSSLMRVVCAWQYTLNTINERLAFKTFPKGYVTQWHISFTKCPKFGTFIEWKQANDFEKSYWTSSMCVESGEWESYEGVVIA